MPGAGRSVASFFAHAKGFTDLAVPEWNFCLMIGFMPFRQATTADPLLMRVVTTGDIRFSMATP